MLTEITIKNFAIIDYINLALQPEMTIISGETGAGKSIIIDALNIALGNRADTTFIPPYTDHYEIGVCFDIKSIALAKEWLRDHDLMSENECLIRRIVYSDSRSKHYINGTPVTLQQLRELGTLLVHIHGQHQHYALLKKEEQRHVLDVYARHGNLLKAIKDIYIQWQNLQFQKRELLGERQDNEARIALLAYQVEELNQLALQENEFDNLFLEQKQLANAEQNLASMNFCLELLDTHPEYAIHDLLHKVLQTILPIKENYPQLDNLEEILSNTIIQIKETSQELKSLLANIDINPQRLSQVEQRLALIHDMARKYKIKPEQLNSHHQQLQEKLTQIKNNEQQLKIILEQETQILAAYQIKAQQLSNSRKKVARSLSQLISKSMQQLGMPQGKFEIQCHPLENKDITPNGIDSVEFLVTSNQGQPLRSLAKVASGGELSRISLAIQVITAEKEATPTLVFDEVDVGIGGGTAEVVGKLLRQLGQKAQILCITHLPQVAAYGHYHLKIDKEIQDKKTVSKIHFLTKKERIHEVARMLGGLDITKNTLAHAKEMVEKAMGNKITATTLD